MQSKILDFLHAERSRWILWCPVAFGAGIGVYFLLPKEPSLTTLAAMLVVSLAGCVATRRHMLCLLLMVAVTFMLLGAGVASWRTASIAAPVLEKPLPYAKIEGVVEEIIYRPEDVKLVLSQVVIDRLTPEETPEKISLTLRDLAAAEGVDRGDRLAMDAGFFPPPLPAFPGGYAFNRHFYFKQLGANGYSFGSQKPEIVQKSLPSEGFFARVEEARQAVFHLFLSQMGAREGAVAAALVMGEQRAIPEPVFEAMRDSGLAHVLSISGLHLALAAGIFYTAIRLILALLPIISLQAHGKKIAAAVALTGALGYLLLAGAPIPAQRSYAMVALVLLAVLFDRQVTPMRSLALAAMVILLFLPESVLNPSFQLSFAATVALVAYYEFRREQKNHNEPDVSGRKRWRVVGYAVDIAVTSAVATVATMPFIIHHFSGFPVYSVLGNLLCISLVSFWIMPVIVLVLLLLPLGLAGWLLPLLKTGIALMITLAEWVAALPMAVIDLPPLSTAGLVFCAAGGLWLCLWQTRMRHIGWLAVAAGMLTLLFYAPPDMILAADGKKIALRTGETQMVMLRGRAEGFTQEQWRRFARVEVFGTFRRREGNDTLRCDRLGCVYHWQGHEIAVAQHRETLWEACGEAALVIIPDWSVYGKSRAGCLAQVIDRRALERSGGMAVWLDKGGIRIRTVREVLGDRPWSAARTNTPR